MVLSKLQHTGMVYSFRSVNLIYGPFLSSQMMERNGLADLQALVAMVPLRM
ncbi:hypothetical protein SAMN04487970_1017114 [Paenibacillus tianmuensis]|uniref:Uncharacterized protein n=1 Tax=Paenibacillus tianmuensis TaxID=624147 RepID=A0A1G4RPQ6_9BACL|nr:hypothetical protein SAMN04487970_1017114 [Paenibacillus tianmuensis]